MEDTPISEEGIQAQGVQAQALDHEGMYAKYIVYRIPEGSTPDDIVPPITRSEAQWEGQRPYPLLEEVEEVFVLIPGKDYHARVALAAYKESVRYWNPSLADDLDHFFELSMPSTMEERLKLKMRPD